VNATLSTVCDCRPNAAKDPIVNFEPATSWTVGQAGISTGRRQIEQTDIAEASTPIETPLSWLLLSLLADKNARCRWPSRSTAGDNPPIQLETARGRRECQRTAHVLSASPSVDRPPVRTRPPGPDWLWSFSRPGSASAIHGQSAGVRPVGLVARRLIVTVPPFDAMRFPERNWRKSSSADVDCAIRAVACIVRRWSASRRVR